LKIRAKIIAHKKELAKRIQNPKEFLAITINYLLKIKEIQEIQPRIVR
jgi:hypothetical protein